MFLYILTYIYLKNYEKQDVVISKFQIRITDMLILHHKIWFR